MCFSRWNLESGASTLPYLSYANSVKKRELIMAKRLVRSGREKLEKEICQNLSQLSDNTGVCEDYIIELEALLKLQQKTAERAQADLSAVGTKLAEASGRIETQKDDIQAMRTDAKLATLQQATTEKELLRLKEQLQDALNDGQAYAEQLKAQLDSAMQDAANEKKHRDGIELSLKNDVEATRGALAEEKSARSALEAELEALHITLNEYRECDKALRERIEILEQMLSEERKKAGQDLLLRIMELETMLEAERTKVDDLEELPTVVHVSRSSAAAPKTTKTTTVLKTESAQKKRSSR